jgi:hypothetical protein
LVSAARRHISGTRRLLLLLLLLLLLHTGQASAQVAPSRRVCC